MNNNDKRVCNNDEPAKRNLCYISVIALFLEIFSLITPSTIKDLIPLTVLAFLISVVSLVRFKISSVKRRGKVLALAALVLSFSYMIILFIAMAIRISEGLEIY